MQIFGPQSILRGHCDKTCALNFSFLVLSSFRTKVMSEKQFKKKKLKSGKLSFLNDEFFYL
jgi:hypothetical protein